MLTQIINLSLTSGHFPHMLKTAYVRQIPKKPQLDHEDFSNYSRVASLPFLAKIIEKVVAARLNLHLEKHDLQEEYQAAYKANHSVETALVSVQNYILRSMDSQHVVVLVMLDLSTDFNTVNHEVLLEQLSGNIGISGIALQWFRSYLTERKQFIRMQNNTSTSVPLTRGVPQGSVLGPLLFSIYTAPIISLFRSYGLPCHSYAAETKSFIAVNANQRDMRNVENRIEDCLLEVRERMDANFLKLKNEKTELVLFGSRQQY